MTDFDLDRVIVFGGTTEGRIIADKLASKKKLIAVCVATEYGESFLKNTDTVRVGRLDEKGMEELFMKEAPTLVIDATHPYADIVTKNIKEACSNTNFRYIRISRDRDIKNREIARKDRHLFNNLDEMICWLNQQDGIIFSTLGAKEAGCLKEISEYKTRVYVRVLPVESSIKLCEEAGFDKDHIISEMGPFSYERNLMMFKSTGSRILLTKDSGKAGGFAEKIKAAEDLNMEIAVLVRPDEESNAETFKLEDLLLAID